jgi:predicted CXXCH cytochrome family protein
MSGCFQSGKATCTSCHDPHWNRTDGNDALLKHADQYCISCHAGLKAATHTNHAVESAGSSCVGCHMPHAMQGVKATMRDHSMSIPEPENTVRYNVPNACNECHTGQSAEWALSYVEKWYPARSARPRMRATAFSLARKEDVRAINVLIRLATDRNENTEIRATAAGYLGRFQSEAARSTVISLAKDPEPMVRIEAARSLGLAGTEAAATTLAGMLNDRYLSVRVEAASSLTSPIFPRMTFASETQKSFDRAVGEFRRSLEIEGDHPHVQVRLGGLEFLLGNLTQARDAYRRALKRNPAEADAYVGLAVLDFQSGDRAEAIRNARRAVEVSGKDQYQKFLERIEGQQ